MSESAPTPSGASANIIAAGAKEGGEVVGLGKRSPGKKRNVTALNFEDEPIDVSHEYRFHKAWFLLLFIVCRHLVGTRIINCAMSCRENGKQFKILSSL